MNKQATDKAGCEKLLETSGGAISDEALDQPAKVIKTTGTSCITSNACIRSAKR